MNTRFSDHNIVVTKTSGWQKTTCPECASAGKPKNRNLSVNIDVGFWHCFSASCNYTGWLEDNQKKTGFTMKKQYTRPQPKKAEYNNDLMAYLEDRGISSETQVKCNLSFEKGAIVFQSYINGQLINRKYRTKDKQKMWLEKDAELVFYNPLIEQKDRKWCIITEGEIDAVTLYECGKDNAVSVPNGAPPLNVKIESHDLSYLESVKEIFPSVDGYLLCMDNDEPGRRLRDEIARRLGFEKCAKVNYPDGCKDINDVIVKHGKKKVIECIDSAESYPINGLHSVEDFEQDVIDFYETGFQPGVETGWYGVDRFYKPRKKEFTIITGIPSHGKSVWLDNLMINIARGEKWKFAIFSPENAPIQRHIANLLEITIGKPFDKQYNGHMSKNEVVEGLKFLKNHFHFLKPEGDSFTIDEILNIAKAAVFKYGINGLVIDPYNEIEHNRGKESETDYISKFLSKVRNFSRESDAHVWVVAHPTKLYKDKGSGEYPIPTPYDISGSAHWRNKADCCVCVYRNFDEKITEIHVQKIRFKECGAVGMSPLKFDIKSNRFREA